MNSDLNEVGFPSGGDQFLDLSNSFMETMK
jgi:hypothetical protein